MYNKNVFLIFFIFIFVLIITCTAYIDNFSINYAPPSKFNKLDRDYNNELLQYLK